MAITTRPIYNTEYFNQVWATEEDFLQSYNDENKIKREELTEEDLKTIYYLVYARFGNTPIANMSLDQFKIKFWSIVYINAPAWKKREEIQTKLRNMSELDLFTASKQIYNTAENPSTEPTTDSQDELLFIERQAVNKNVRGKVEGYASLWDLIKTDVTTIFLDKFKVLFKKFVRPEHPIIYESED